MNAGSPANINTTTAHARVAQQRRVARSEMPFCTSPKFGHQAQRPRGGFAAARVSAVVELGVLEMTEVHRQRPFSRIITLTRCPTGAQQ